MPFRRKNWKKKPYKKKRYYPSPSKSLGPLANTLKAKFIYSDYFSIETGVAGIPGHYVFAANGLYDPNITGSGHQPSGFDQLVGPLYDHAVVIGAKITLWAQNSDTLLSNMVSLLVRDAAAELSDPRQIMEYRYQKSRIMSPEGSGQNTAVLSMQINPNKFLGRSKPLSDPELKNSNTGNADELCYFHVYCLSPPDRS